MLSTIFGILGIQIQRAADKMMYSLDDVIIFLCDLFYYLLDNANFLLN